MARINESYRKLEAGYLFPEIARRVRTFSEANPDAHGSEGGNRTPLIRRDPVGTLPLPSLCGDDISKRLPLSHRFDTLSGLKYKQRILNNVAERIAGRPRGGSK